VRTAAICRADRVTGDSDDVLEGIARVVPGAAERSRLVFWGVDAGRFSEGDPGAPSLRGELGIPEGAIVLLSNRLCSLHYQVERIVERFVASVGAPDIYLVVRAQPGCDPAYIDRCKNAAGAARNVRFLARPLPDLELPNLYRSADIVLHYPKTDATPVSMLEAISCGRAVLCSDLLPSYTRIQVDYAIERAPLEAMGEALIRRLAAERPWLAEANRAALLRMHSRERSVEAVADAFSEAIAVRSGRSMEWKRWRISRW
jgi:glycosyltransferase involved in cell wall biosynthesis